jgi:hypothetical protein
MSNKIYPGEYIIITFHRRPDTGLPDNMEGLCARVQEVYDDGRVSVDLLYHYALLGVAPHVELHPGEYEPVTLKSYGVTVCRTGYVSGILAPNENQAKEVVDLFITADEVNWSNDWPSSDAEVEG